MTTFTALNKERKENYADNDKNNAFIGSFSRNFKKLLNKCNSSPGKYFAAVPVVN